MENPQRPNDYPWTIPKTIPPPSAAGNSPQLVTPQTEPLWNRKSHSAWSVAHGVTTFFLSKLELAIEALNGHERVLYGGLHGDPELTLLLAKLEGNHRSALDGRLASAKEGKGKRSLEKEIDKAGDFIDDLLDFQKKVRVALERGYDPDIDDGVIINMAPLHELIPWPERVKEKCRKDKSLAIAHGLDK